MRVTAAAFRGKPVYFETRGPWSVPTRMIPDRVTATQRISQVAFGVLLLAVLVGCGWFARRNLQLGRGDRRGGFRVARFMSWILMLSWVFGAHHVPDVNVEIDLWMEAFGKTFVVAAILWAIYLAFEPFVRRRMPDLLIGWARLIEGRWRDPRVGRDILIGGLFGCAIALVVHVVNGLPAWIPIRGQTTIPPDFAALAGGGSFFAFFFRRLSEALQMAVLPFTLLFLLRVVLRNSKLAIAAFAVIITITRFGGENPMIEIPGAVAIGALTTVLLARYGLLAGYAGMVFASVLGALPLPVDFSAPYASATVLSLVMLCGILVYAFRVSLGARPIFSGALDA